MHRHSLDCHVTRNHVDKQIFGCNQCGKSYARSANLELHKRTCTGAVAAALAVERRSISALTPEFAVRKKRRSLGGASEMYTVDMK